MKIAVVIAAHDGLVSLVTGVGVVVNSFIESFKELKNKVKIFKENEVNLICVPPYLRKDSKDYNKNIADRTKNACLENGGYVFDLPTFSNGESEGSIWGDLNQWKSASLSLSTYLRSLQNDYDKILLFSHDTIFVSVRKFIPDMKNLNIIWIPHSLGKIFEDEYSNKERIEFEESSINSIMESNNDYVGYIGDFFRKILNECYFIPDNKLISLRNGLYENSYRYNESYNHKNYLMNKYKIPKNKKLIFSWGRCVYQKGFDILIPSIKEFLDNNLDYHLVLLMPVETSLENYIFNIKEELKKLNSDSYTTIYNFEEYLPSVILGLDNLDMVVFPSRFEGSAITALEANTFSKEEVKIIYSNILPNIDIFRNNPFAIPFISSDINSLKEIFRNIDSFKPNTQIERNYENIVENYSFGLNNIDIR